MEIISLLKNYFLKVILSFIGREYPSGHKLRCLRQVFIVMVVVETYAAAVIAFPVITALISDGLAL